MQSSKEVAILKIEDVLPNRFQPRLVFDENAINELTESIKTYGVIEPIIVRKVSDKYEIIAGERRYKASVLAGKQTIPAIITELNDKDSAEIALIENVQRQNLTPIEEAVSYKKILDMGYMNQVELARKLGKTQSTIANKLRLLNLTDTVQEALLQEKISERHARSLLRLKGNSQNEMLDRIIKERMTVRKTDEEINKILHEGEVEEKKETPIVVKEEKEGENMNENMNNSFNIPNTPIMNATVEPVQPAAPAAPQPTPVAPQPEPVMPTPVAPVPPVAPQPVMPTVEAVTPSPQTISNEPANTENEDTPISGRFFNMFGESSEPVSAPVAPTPVAQVPVGPEAPVVQPVQEPAPMSFNPFGEMPQAPIAPQPTPVAPHPEPVMPTPVAPATPVMPTIEQPVPQPMPAAPVAPQVEKTPAITPDALEPIPMPSVEVSPVAPTMPDSISPIQTFQLNDSQEFTNSSVVEMGTIGNRNIEEPTLEPLMETGLVMPKVEMKEIINMIRNCSSQIEKSGYKIETDELDFDDSYQVIFKITKND